MNRVCPSCQVKGEEIENQVKLVLKCNNSNCTVIVFRGDTIT